MKLPTALGPYLLYLKLASAAAAIAGAFFLGRNLGADAVQQRWDRATAAQAEADRKETQNALDETRRLAKEAEARARADLEAAVKASEERQAARLAQAVRQATLEAATRRGAYVAPECRLDAETYEALQEQLNGGRK